MSHIFDALQRSEAKRTKSDVPFTLAVIELLERAERAAAAQTAMERTAEAGAGEPERANSIFGPDGLGGAGTGPDPAVVGRAMEAVERAECFGQFETLETSITEQSLLVCITDPHCPAGEALRLLAVRMRHLRLRRELKSLLVTSTVPGEGKSMVAANLACALGSGEKQKVLLLEGDVRLPSLPRVFGMRNVPGLCNYLKGERSLIASIYYLANAGIWILPAGDKAREPLDLIQSPQLPELMRKLNSWFDWIVIDSPPVLPLADTSEWARLADGILLVTRRATTQRRKLQRGLEALDQNKFIGAVMNCSNGTASGDYYYYRPHSETDRQSQHEGE